MALADLADCASPRPRAADSRYAGSAGTGVNRPDGSLAAAGAELREAGPMLMDSARLGPEETLPAPSRGRSCTQFSCIRVRNGRSAYPFPCLLRGREAL